MRDLPAWLAYLERLHPKAIELGLDRVRTVRDRLGLQQLPFPVITVGGTNGKGSTCALLEAFLHCSGYRVGCYTSPHLVHYNERVRIGGEQVTDGDLVRAFERVDAARGEVSLTYFEFGTLAAAFLFVEAGIECGVLEVGLGGRLDADGMEAYVLRPRLAAARAVEPGERPDRADFDRLAEDVALRAGHGMHPQKEPAAGARLQADGIGGWLHPVMPDRPADGKRSDASELRHSGASGSR